MISFFSLPSEIGNNGPVGLVLRHGLTKNNSTALEDQTSQVWVFNIGGSYQTNNPISGLNVPIFVIFGGVLGGYIRYLYKAASKIDVPIAASKIDVPIAARHQDDEHSMRPRKFVHETFEEISEIMLSGLLAIIVWFILSQGTLNANVYTLGAISLSVGLLTREIVTLVKNFSTKFLPSSK
jgi:hypothetical protein